MKSTTWKEFWESRKRKVRFFEEEIFIKPRKTNYENKKKHQYYYTEGNKSSNKGDLGF